MEAYTMNVSDQSAIVFIDFDGYTGFTINCPANELCSDPEPDCLVDFPKAQQNQHKNQK
jgi:hypothetical protein